MTFGSDNHAPVHPAIMEAILDVNTGAAPAYGIDQWSQALQEVISDEFGAQAKGHVVLNGSAANVLGIGSCLKRHESIICAHSSHLSVDECGAPEAVLGTKLVVVPAVNGKLMWGCVEPCLIRSGDQHFAQPRVLSLTQSTELGTVYSLKELKNLCDKAHGAGLLVHMDGARACNAAAALGCTLKEMTTDVGLDVVSFGGAKNGLLFGELVLFLNPDLGEDFRFMRKQTLQLGAKLRYASASFLRYFEGGLWRELAGHANTMAKRLSDGLQALGKEEVVVSRPTEANAVFVRFPRPWVKTLKEIAFFYVWDEATFECRLMCSWDTTEEQVDRFIDAVASMN